MYSRLGPARARWTGRAEGDLRVGAEGSEERRRAVLDRPWTCLRQVHGDRVIVVDGPGAGAGEEADAAVTAHPGAALAVFTADCAPVALASPEGVIGAVHAGWRGLTAGVVERAVEAMRALGATDVEAALGPCIHPCCYEFSAADLERFDPEVRGTTRDGAPALDLPAAVRLAVERSGARLVHDEDRCTACAEGWFSHRARGETERQAMVVWIP
jgi:YfiH family protein